MPPLRSFVRPFLLFLLIALVLIPLSWLPAPWVMWRPATCLPDACFCEALGDGFIRQPIDTWSNLAFVLVGVLIVEDVCAASRRMNSAAGVENTLKRVSTRFICQTSISIEAQRADTRNSRQPPVYGLTYACAAILIGLGSWFYHASLTFVGQWFDVMGMYLLGTFMVLYNVARLRPLSNRAFVIGYAAFNLALGVSLIIVPELRRYLFGGLLVMTIVLEGLLRQRRRNRVSPGERGGKGESRNPVSDGGGYFVAALLIYVLAQIIWTLDLNHIVCHPHGLLQGHAIWHVLTALSAGLLYLYYRSEHVTLSGGASGIK
ncbi:MAG TPA: ceramidase domain-containing protein [Anaerolineae bacterium]|nr:ceramidase domain-containing protein [Anaerolineae bacterium]